MAEHTKISVEVPTRDLVQQVAKAQGRSMGKQIATWAKKDAKRLGIGTAMPASQAIPAQPHFSESEKVNTNRQKNGGQNNNVVG